MCRFVASVIGHRVGQQVVENGNAGEQSMKQPHTADTGDETAPVAPANTGFRPWAPHPITSKERHL